MFLLKFSQTKILRETQQYPNPSIQTTLKDSPEPSESNQRTNPVIPNSIEPEVSQAAQTNSSTVPEPVESEQDRIKSDEEREIHKQNYLTKSRIRTNQIREKYGKNGADSTDKELLAFGQVVCQLSNQGNSNVDIVNFSVVTVSEEFGRALTRDEEMEISELVDSALAIGETTICLDTSR